MSAERDRMISAVRVALGDRPQPPARPAPWSRPAPEDPATLFAERAGEYRAHVQRCSVDGIADCVAALCREHGAARLAVPPDLPTTWLPPGLTVETDASAAALDAVDGVLTGCACAIADSGTIVLDGGPGQGVRALTLVPDLHICVVQVALVVASMPEAIARVGAAVRERGAPLTFVAGPSATGDIEFTRVEGVHGPRRLEIVLAG